jgi:cytochrome P450
MRHDQSPLGSGLAVQSGASDSAAMSATVEFDTAFASFDHFNTPLDGHGTPYGYYCAIRDKAASSGQYVGWSEAHGGFWLIVGYEESNWASKNIVDFSNSEPTLPRYKTTEPFIISGTDDPEHRFARALVNASFNPAGVKRFERLIRDNTNLLIDSFIERGRADVAKVIGMPVPAIVTAMILGVPTEDSPNFSRWIHAVSSDHLHDPDGAGKEIRTMYEYFGEVIERRRHSPGEDILSQVVHSEVDGKRFNIEELRGFCTNLMVGGIDNTNRLLSTMLWRVGWDHELRDRLVRNKVLIKKSIQEFLRFYSPACIVRSIRRDVEYGGVSMKAGQLLMMAEPIANRDPRAFAYPDTFIPDRHPNLHLGLGVGIHRCLGAHLIALEAQVMLEEFLERIPNYSLDPSRPHSWAAGQVAGMSSVPIVFEPGSSLNPGTLHPGVAAWIANAERAGS